MYSDEEKDVGIESIDKAKSNVIKSGRMAYRGIRFVSQTASKTKKALDNFNVKKKYDAVPKTVSKTNVGSANIEKLNTGRSISKNIVSGTIRVNGILVENLYNKHDDTNSGANAMLAASKNISKSVDTVKDAINVTKKAYKTTKKTAEYAIKIGKHIVGFLIANPIVLVVLLICFAIIFLASSIDDEDDMLLMFSGLSTDVVMTDEESIDKYKGLLVNLDLNYNNSISHGDYKEYDDVVINGSANTSFKEILSLLAVEKEQDILFNDNNSIAFGTIHSKIYKTENDVSIYYCDGCSCPHSKEDNCPGNCQCLGHSRLTINVVQFSFEEMLDNLDFNQDQKDMARRFVEKDYKEIYSNWGD